MGETVELQIVSLQDGDLQIRDILGSTTRRSQAAIHISGFDPFGHKTGPGFIRAIGMYKTVFADGKKAFSGLGCDGAEPVLIVSWDRDESHTGDR